MTAGQHGQEPAKRDAVPLKMREPFADPAYRLEDGWLLLEGGAEKTRRSY